MSQIEIYSTNNCPFCTRAKQLLNSKNIAYTEKRIDENPEFAKEMQERTQKRTVPQIIINGNPIGGFDELYALNRDGKLDELLK